MIRRKAQAMITMPNDPNARDQELAGRFLEMLSPGPAGTAPVASAQPPVIAEEGVAVVEIDEGAPVGSEASEHVAFSEIKNVIDTFKGSLEALKAHETQEKEEGTATKADKAEGKAIKKLEKILEELEETYEELCEAEEKEHKEKDKPASGEVVAKKEEDEVVEEVEEKKEASKKDEIIDESMLNDLT